MERNANFIVVGIFAIVSVLCLAAFAFWLGKYGVDEDKFDNYKTYIRESVSGLKASSPVRLKGLDVGFVEEVKIDHDNPEQVEVTFKVDKGTPIKTDSVIVLSSQGIAGIGYLEIKNGTKDSPFLKSIDKSERPSVKSEPSMLSALTDKADTILSGVADTMTKVNQFTSDKNIKNVTVSLDNLAQITTGLKEDRKEISGVLKGAKEVEANASNAITELSKVTRKADAVLDETKTLAKESTSLIREIKKADVIEKLSATIDNTNDTIDETKGLVREGKSLIRQLQESPSDLLFKNKTLKPGPGE
jgi:phospholipid/cholesterol/gamma-HCH transport system substrate-binding protein